MRRRNFPKGYAEMLEKQHNQLVCGLQEMYQRLRKASLWEGEPLDESSGRPLTHDILAALNFLEPQEDGSDAEFVEQPRSSSLLEGLDDDSERTTAVSSQELSQPTSHDSGVFFDSDIPAQTANSRSSSNALSPMTPGPRQPSGQPTLQSLGAADAPKLSLSAISPPVQLDALWNDPLYCYDASQAPSNDSSLDSTNWCFETPAMLLPLVTQLPALNHDDISSHKRTSSAPRPSLCHNRLGNGIGFDSSDLMSDFHQLSPQDTTDNGLCQYRTVGSLS